MTDRSTGWVLDGEAFEGLLTFLDADRQLAAEKYEDIRRRLLKLFTWRGCTVPDEYVDRTIDRVARRLADGATVTVADPYQYFHGVALNVLREHWREPARQADVRGADAAAHAVAVPEVDRAADEQQLTCLDGCLSRMTPEHRELLLAYHAGDRHIERRRAIATSLSISLTALRIRAHRLRTAMESCVTRCLGTTSNETKPANAH